MKIYDLKERAEDLSEISGKLRVFPDRRDFLLRIIHADVALMIDKGASSALDADTFQISIWT